MHSEIVEIKIRNIEEVLARYERNLKELWKYVGDLSTQLDYLTQKLKEIK